MRAGTSPAPRRPASSACGPGECNRRCWDGACRRRENDSPYQPAIGKEETHGYQHRHENAREPLGALPQKGVEHVAAVELPYGQKIQRRRQQTDPGRAGHGVQINIGGGLAVELNHLEQSQDQGRADDQIAMTPPGTILDIDTPTARGQTSKAKPASGPAMPISNKMRLERIAERMRMEWLPWFRSAWERGRKKGREAST